MFRRSNGGPCQGQARLSVIHPEQINLIVDAGEEAKGTEEPWIPCERIIE